MSDTKCRVCFERWNKEYVHTYMTQWESRLFLAGKGCPCCQGHDFKSWNYDVGMSLSNKGDSNV